MNNPLGSVAAAMLAFVGGVAHAQAPADVEVRLGPAVLARQHELGTSELSGESSYLQQQVQRALAGRGADGVRVSLILEDIEPNLPTSAQLGRSPGLQAGSPGLGGAAVTGEVTTADGRRTPLRFRWFQEEPRNEVNFTTWGDADEAFDRLADALRAGRTPDDASSWPPPHGPRVVTGTLIP